MAMNDNNVFDPGIPVLLVTLPHSQTSPPPPTYPAMAMHGCYKPLCGIMYHQKSIILVSILRIMDAAI